MNEEENKAIEILKSVRISLMNFNEVTEENKEVITSIQTIVDYIEKQQKELKQKEKQIDRYQNMLATNDMLHVMECENKDKVIKKMSLKIAKVDNSDTYCSGKKRMCPYDNPTLSKCAECVKKYYEKRCKNGNCKSRQNNDSKL